MVPAATREIACNALLLLAATRLQKRLHRGKRNKREKKRKEKREKKRERKKKKEREEGKRKKGEEKEKVAAKILLFHFFML